MIHEIRLPQQGVTSNEATIVKWEVQEGQEIRKDDILVVFETDKAAYELESPADGFVKIIHAEGSALPMGEIIGLVATSFEEYSQIQASRTARNAHSPSHTDTRLADLESTASLTAGAPVRITGVARNIAQEHGLDLSSIKGTGPSGRITKSDVEQAIAQSKDSEATVMPKKRLPATPLIKISGVARKLAQEHGLDLSSLKGTGPGLRITIEDVKKVLSKEKPIHSVPPVESFEPRLKEVFPFRGKVRVMAERLTESLRAMAPMTHWEEVDMTELIDLKESGYLKAVESSQRFTYGDLFVKLTAQAVKEFPLLNASVIDDQVKLWEDINIGMAVAVGETLVVPVIRDVGSKSILEISRKMQDLVNKARENRLTMEDLMGATITITNIGAFGANPGTPIIQLPQVAIVGFGRIEKKPVVKDDVIVIRPMLLMSITVDHRVITGGVAAMFRLRLKALLENPKKAILSII